MRASLSQGNIFAKKRSVAISTVTTTFITLAMNYATLAGNTIDYGSSQGTTYESVTLAGNYICEKAFCNHLYFLDRLLSHPQ